MAVEVIGHSEEVARKATCVGCGAILRYYKNDVSSRTVGDYGGGSDTYYSIICAKCEKRVDVKVWY